MTDSISMYNKIYAKKRNSMKWTLQCDAITTSSIY